MDTLAHGPVTGPWILLLPLVWASVAAGFVVLLRRTGVWRGPRGHLRGYASRPAAVAPGPRSPVALLGRRFAAGEIDEEEYWRRLSVLDEQFGRRDGGPS
ncbi:SHOCT domain-containing protein [Streptomyces sp. NPDC001985]|uniref:SHOCT domain-containing protein n=1 Tax=Streptomyces sp. NPDC001985 TaxID=3154406 RepID=UPI00332609CB